MAFTPEDVLNAAYAKDKKNQPQEMATEATELLDVVARALRGLFAFATRLNPTYFGKKSNIASPGAGNPWTLPTDLEHLFRVEESGTKVYVVPYDDRALADPDPAVYQFGQELYDAGNTNDPDPGSDALDVFYAKQAEAPSSLTSNLDSSYPDAYKELMVLEVAIYLALKDGRPEDARSFIAQRNEWARLFANHVAHYVPPTIERFYGPQELNVEAVELAGQLLAGSALDGGG